jgi:hypothetical protein
MARPREKPEDKIDISLVFELASRGATERYIAKKLNYEPSNFHKVKKRSAALRTAIKKGKEAARDILDGDVENALHRSACGFFKTDHVMNSRGKIVEVRKYYPPNIIAAIFWLKNRKPNEWKDKREIGGEIEGTVVFKSNIDHSKLKSFLDKSKVIDVDSTKQIEENND